MSRCEKLVEKFSTVDEAVTVPEFKALASKLEQLRKSYKPTDEEALLISMFRDITFKIAKGSDTSAVLKEIKNYVPLRDK